jgi:hypothetical protein
MKKIYKKINKKINRKLVKIMVIGTMSTALSSCAFLMPDRTFLEEMDRTDEAFYAPGKDFPVVGGDTGEIYRSRDEIKKRTPSSARNARLDKERKSIENELQDKEEALTEEEMARYRKDEKYLQTESEKLYYLSLAPSERSEMIQGKVQDLTEEINGKHNVLYKRSIHSNEITLGMEKNEVLQMWGKPARVEIAGNPSHQNERWSFVEDGNVKQVYFESGRVQGWALDL